MLTLLIANVMFLPLQTQTVRASEKSSIEMYFPNDIEGHWAYDELDNFVVADLLNGYEEANGEVTIRPEKTITRSEFVALLVRALGLQSSEQNSKTFTDVPADKWYYEPIRIASSLGIVNGVSDKSFGPNKPINRGDIATMIVRAFDDTVEFGGGTSHPFEDVPSYYATQSIIDAYGADIIKGLKPNKFMPFSNAKRAEAVVMLQRALDIQKSDLPNEEALKSLISAADETEIHAINTGEVFNLGKLYNEHFTAYQLMSNQEYAGTLQEIVQESYSIELYEATARTLDVVFASDRFAVVKSTGGSYRFTYWNSDDTNTITESNDGFYCMKKMEDNKWKIYAIYQEDEQ